jgi:molybdate transport repressor ModE-like protein
VGDNYVFGLGLCEFLEAVESSNSIKHLACQVGKSYRYVCGRIKAAEKALGGKLVEAPVGGKGIQRSVLTPMARGLIEFRSLRERMIDTLHQEFAGLFD